MSAPPGCRRSGFHLGPDGARAGGGLAESLPLGANENVDEIRTNKAAPEIWRNGLFYAPHGIAYDTNGNLFVTEFNMFGRVTKARRN